MFSALRSLVQLRELYDQEAPEHVHLIEILGYMSMLAETSEAATALLDEAVALSFKSSQPNARYWIHLFCGAHFGPRGWKLNIAGAQTAYENLLAEAIQRRDTFGQAGAYASLMHVAFYQMQLAQAAQLAEQTILLSQQVNAEQPILSSLHCLAEIALMEGRLDAAHNYIEISQNHNVKYGYRHTTIHALGLRMRLVLIKGDHSSAWASLTDLQRYTLLTDSAALFRLETLAALEAIEGRYVRAARLFSAIEAKRERERNPWWPKDHAQLDRYINATCHQLGEAAFATIW